MKRLIISLIVSWLSLVAPTFAQGVITPVQMRDTNLATTSVQNVITTLLTFTAPRTLTLPGRGGLNSYYAQFVDTANAVNGGNTLTIRVADGSLINGSSTLVITTAGAYLFIIPNSTGYYIFNSVAFGGLPSLANDSFWIGNASNVATAVTLSGDCTSTNAGVITCLKTNGVAFGALATLGVGTGLSSGGGNLNITSTITAGGPVGDATHVSQVTYNAQGQLTAVASVAITGTAPGGTAGGDLSGTYPNPTIANITSGATQAGSLVGTNIAAPSSPAAAHVTTWMDSTDLRLHDKNASGTIGTTVVADTGASNNFLTAISAAGVISKAQPAFTNISGTAQITQGGTAGTTQQSALNNVAPTPTRAGDIIYYNGTNWVNFAGNNSGTQFFQENSSGVPTWATVSGTGTVTSVACGTGLDGGTITTSGTCSLSAARRTLPTTSIATATSHTGGMSANSSGTYTVPANVLWIEVRLIGGGGGGASGGNGGVGGSGGDTCLSASGAACTSPVYDAGGGGGGTGTSAGGPPGAISGSGTCTNPIAGGGGQGGTISFVGVGGSPGGIGAGSSLGGGGGATNGASAGGAGATNSGAGGGGGGMSAASGLFSGGGGGSGATCKILINTPSATYTYAVGAAGTGNTSPGSGGQNGGAGAAGQVEIIEHYGT